MLALFRCTEGYRSGHNGAVLKTVRRKRHVGSNPTPSAKKENRAKVRFSFFRELRQQLGAVSQSENASDPTPKKSFTVNPKNGKLLRHSARQLNIVTDFDLEKYPRGRRGSPAKGVGRDDRRGGSNPPFSAKRKNRTTRPALSF